MKGNHEAGAARGQEVRRACWDGREGAEEVSRCLHLGVPGAELRRRPCKWTHRRRANHERVAGSGKPTLHLPGKPVLSVVTHLVTTTPGGHCHVSDLLCQRERGVQIFTCNPLILNAGHIFNTTKAKCIISIGQWFPNFAGYEHQPVEL